VHVGDAAGEAVLAGQHGQLGVAVAPVSVRKRKRSAVTGWLSGAPSVFQSGISSLIARGSMIAPDRMCAPGSEPFSRTTTETS